METSITTQPKLRIALFESDPAFSGFPRPLRIGIRLRDNFGLAPGNHVSPQQNVRLELYALAQSEIRR